MKKVAYKRAIIQVQQQLEAARQTIGHQNTKITQLESQIDKCYTQALVLERKQQEYLNVVQQINSEDWKKAIRPPYSRACSYRLVRSDCFIEKAEHERLKSDHEKLKIEHDQIVWANGQLIEGMREVKTKLGTSVSSSGKRTIPSSFILP